MEIRRSPQAQPQTQVAEMRQAGAAAGAVKDPPSPGTPSRSQSTSTSQQSTYVNQDGKSKESSARTRPDTNKPTRQRDRTSLLNKDKPAAAKTNGAAAGEVLLDGQSRKKPSVDLRPKVPASYSDRGNWVKTEDWIRDTGEETRIRANKTHPGAPPGYGGVTKQLPPEVQKKAEDLQKQSIPADKGEKFLVMDKEGKVYVACVEGDPKRVSVYEKKPPNPPWQGTTQTGGT
jgi:hypothetical protein